MLAVVDPIISTVTIGGVAVVSVHTDLVPSCLPLECSGAPGGTSPI